VLAGESQAPRALARCSPPTRPASQAASLALVPALGCLACAFACADDEFEAVHFLPSARPDTLIAPPCVSFVPLFCVPLLAPIGEFPRPLFGRRLAPCTNTKSFPIALRFVVPSSELEPLPCHSDKAGHNTPVPIASSELEHSLESKPAPCTRTRPLPARHLHPLFLRLLDCFHFQIPLPAPVP